MNEHIEVQLVYGEALDPTQRVDPESIRHMR
jgi:hypothetical protein